MKKMTYLKYVTYEGSVVLILRQNLVTFFSRWIVKKFMSINKLSSFEIIYQIIKELFRL